MEPSHVLFLQNPQAIQLVIYFDELEVCNPLGAQSGVHKLGQNLNPFLPCRCVCTHACIYVTGVFIM